MNNWFSTQIPSSAFSLSSSNKIIFPELPETPTQPLVQLPKANPPILFLPQSSQLNL
ncbi:hypothetical protein WJM97_12525 [Okeanomitos corallinicola TIOX110]|uniref:Restriction endonuclease n=1 Tax=Okeanomitos corallinicola TIOX110 TaxID=3133117 RepID=A0ABZ2ULU1_9CYAN